MIIDFDVKDLTGIIEGTNYLKTETDKLLVVSFFFIAWSMGVRACAEILGKEKSDYAAELLNQTMGPKMIQYLDEGEIALPQYGNRIKNIRSRRGQK